MSNAPKLHKSPSCLYLTRCERREAWPCEVKEAGMRLGGDERERGRQTKREGKKERTRKKGGKKERTQADLSERLGDTGLGAGMVQGYKSRLRLQSCVRCDSIGRSFGEAGTLRPNSRKRCRFLSCQHHNVVLPCSVALCHLRLDLQHDLCQKEAFLKSRHGGRCVCRNGRDVSAVLPLFLELLLALLLFQ